MVCPRMHARAGPEGTDQRKCGAEMKVIAVIEDPDELKRILQHLIKIGRAPPGFDPDQLN